MCKWGSGDLSCDIIPSCVISNHFWWLEILEHNFCFAIFFIIQVFWFFYVLGLDSCIIISDSIFWITKSLVSCFCATTKLELLALRFFWFCVCCYAWEFGLVVSVMLFRLVSIQVGFLGVLLMLQILFIHKSWFAKHWLA
jgi:hypothetical protein